MRKWIVSKLRSSSVLLVATSKVFQTLAPSVESCLLCIVARFATRTIQRRENRFFIAMAAVSVALARAQPPDIATSVGCASSGRILEITHALRTHSSRIVLLVSGACLTLWRAVRFSNVDMLCTRAVWNDCMKPSIAVPCAKRPSEICSMHGSKWMSNWRREWKRYETNSRQNCWKRSSSACAMIATASLTQNSIRSARTSVQDAEGTTQIQSEKRRKRVLN